ncbi:DUF6093 family protein [Bifidobacterium castoris]|uniref:Phage associated protein n=1 Tax=Bifidobacterium castoris TaxID=2306972 RepID=A0A430F558_9BIFI|nr:DUF6093 family protein [Bifidobacterium castoris]RSX46116.1 phage associated protein [Bifidobacterium castoris]
MSTLARGRSDALRLMGDICTVSRPTGRFEVDPDTGVTTPVVDVIYHGACRVQTAGGVASQVVSASGDSTNVGGNVPVWSLYLHLPYTATGCRPGDIAHIDSSMDAALVGARLRLVNLQSEKTLATAARWNVSQMPREAEATDE